MTSNCSLSCHNVAAEVIKVKIILKQNLLIRVRVHIDAQFNGIDCCHVIFICDICGATCCSETALLDNFIFWYRVQVIFGDEKRFEKKSVLV